MTGRRTLLVVASILLAAIGTALVWLYVQGAETRARDEAQASVDLRPVYVATVGADAGALGAAVVPKPAQVPVDLATDAVTPQVVAQQKLRVAVVPGTILRNSMFTSEEVSGVGDTKEAVSITFGEPQRVPALIRAEDDVSIYALVPSRPAKLVVPHVRVRSVGSLPGQAGVAQQIITFEASPDTVRLILDLASSGQTPQLVINGKGAEPVPD